MSAVSLREKRRRKESRKRNRQRKEWVELEISFRNLSHIALRTRRDWPRMGISRLIVSKKKKDPGSFSRSNRRENRIAFAKLTDWCFLSIPSFAPSQPDWIEHWKASLFYTQTALDGRWHRKNWIDEDGKSPSVPSRSSIVSLSLSLPSLIRSSILVDWWYQDRHGSSDTNLRPNIWAASFLSIFCWNPPLIHFPPGAEALLPPAMRALAASPLGREIEWAR